MSFAALRAKPTAELEALLARGDAPERLWAAWALAMRDGSTPELVERLVDDPSEGVRAHLVNVVADPTRLTILRAIAEHDSSTLVRATACRAIARIAARSSEDAAWIAHRYEIEGGDVRHAILSDLASDSPVLPALIRSAERDGSEELLVAALRRRVERGDDVSGAFVRTRSARVRDAILDAIIAAHGTEAVLRTEQPEIARAILERAIATLTPFDEALMRLFDRPSPAIARGLAHAARLGLVRPDLGQWMALWSGPYGPASGIVLEHLPEALVEATPDARKALRGRLVALRKELEQMMLQAGEDDGFGEVGVVPDDWTRAHDALDEGGFE